MPCSGVGSEKVYRVNSVGGLRKTQGIDLCTGGFSGSGTVCIVEVSADSCSFVILDTLAASMADAVRLRHGIG